VATGAEREEAVAQTTCMEYLLIFVRYQSLFVVSRSMSGPSHGPRAAFKAEEGRLHVVRSTPKTAVKGVVPGAQSGLMVTGRIRVRSTGNFVLPS
jgi:hypothetical protein